MATFALPDEAAGTEITLTLSKEQWAYVKAHLDNGIKQEGESYTDAMLRTCVQAAAMDRLSVVNNTNRTSRDASGVTEDNTTTTDYTAVVAIIAP